MKINQNKCLQCGKCEIECEHDAIYTEPYDVPDSGAVVVEYFINADKCQDCGRCIEVCLNEAVES